MKSRQYGVGCLSRTIILEVPYFVFASAGASRVIISMNMRDAE